ncbi:hypothetical protein Y1Q_0011566 [Alligator mississippiensis]|uniref:Uncharacterized protein n=1 Tax=Alligator mississippiensis TaxID=8496 RepID=A0A151M0C5_ALLMI|nr:hypothetical protein Y1Q_0011566 [Alligator mississippiensis]
MTAENHLADTQAWRVEDIAHEDALDCADQEFQVQFLALVRKCVEALWDQSAPVAMAVEATEDDYWRLGTWTPSWP